MMAESQPTPRFAFLGVRSCELHAIGIQDAVFLRTSYTDPEYAARREYACIIAVIRTGETSSADHAGDQADEETRA